MIIQSIFTVRLVAMLGFLLINATVFSQQESVTCIGINGRLTNLQDALLLQKISAKSAQVFTINTFMLKDTKWEKVGSEQYKMLNDSTFQIKGRREDSKVVITRTFAPQPDGIFKFSDLVNEQVIRNGYAKSIAPLLLHGTVMEYYPGGKKKSVSQYKENELISNENWNADGTKYIDNIFYSVDSYPFFDPGNKALHEHIIKEFKDADIDVAGIDGSIRLGFVVMENGTIGGIKILKGLVPIVNSIAIQSFATLKGTWTPAKLNNQTVRYFQEFPINFKYKENHFEFAEIRGGVLHYQTD